MSRTACFFLGACLVMVLPLSGCTSPGEYVRNGFKVGPNVGIAQGQTAPQWIESTDARVRSDPVDLSQWWSVFNDPKLNGLIAHALQQNLSLREAGFRVLEARAQLGVAAGNLFPQAQQATGSYQREAVSQVSNFSPGFATQFYDQWTSGFNLSWEIDFWGRFRRAVLAAEDTLDASAAGYDYVLVSLQGDIASNYVQIRTIQQRLAYLQANVDLQSKILEISEKRLKAGSKGAAADTYQARSNLALTEAQAPLLKYAMRQACNRLCVLLAMPTIDLEKELGIGPIPTAPAAVTVGIPADLLRRRPDVRRAERQAAAQGEQIGIATADLYPMLFINGTLGWASNSPGQLFTSQALTSTVGPAYQWNIFNYGRIRNNIRQQWAEFNALVAHYQETVLRANAEVEDGLAEFLRSQERAQLLDLSVKSAQQAVEIVSKEYQGGAAGFSQVVLIELNLVQQQDQRAVAHGEIAQGLIHTYRALGGGWELGAAAGNTVPTRLPTTTPESIPIPTPPPSTAAAPGQFKER
jgi:NodT family efflux transporter outer membrane factor (OMF) lipoprotein